MGLPRPRQPPCLCRIIGLTIADAALLDVVDTIVGRPGFGGAASACVGASTSTFRQILADSRVPGSGLREVC